MKATRLVVGVAVLVVACSLVGCPDRAPDTVIVDENGYPVPDERFSAPPPSTQAKRDDLERLKICVATDPTSADAWTNLGWRLYKDGAYSESSWAMNEARNRAPEDLYVLWLSGLCEFALGNIDESKSYLWKLTIDHKEWPETVDMGITYDVLGRIALVNLDLFEASIFFGKAADVLPKNWQVRFLRGVVECERARTYSGRYADALDSLAQAKALRPNHPLVLRYFAFVKAAMDVNWPSEEDPKFEGALKAIDEAIAADPQDAANFILKGQVLQALGDNRKAEESFRRGVALDPDASWPKYLLAKLIAAHGSPTSRDEAERLLVQSIALQPGLMAGLNEAPHLGLLTELLLEDGEAERAVDIADWLLNEEERN